MKSIFPKSLVLGLALFSMFFGSGNLIFPLAVGQSSGDFSVIATFGFLTTGVFVPFLGVLAMIAFDGQYLKFFQTFSSKLAFVFVFSLLLFWIPLGSAPRCVTLAYANVYQILPFQISLWLFSLFYCSLVFWLSKNQSQLLDLLGRYLTPVLLLTLSFLFLSALLSESAQIQTASLTKDAYQAFKLGLLEGYNTMDLIASFFFSATIIQRLKESENTSLSEDHLHLTLRSCLVGMLVLALVYCGLIMIASKHVSVINESPKDQLLPTLALALLGPKLSILAKICVFLACLTTSMALLDVFSEFLSQRVFQEKYSLLSMQMATTLLTYCLSILGFEGISRLSVPVFQVIYPALLVMIFIVMFKKLFKREKLLSAIAKDY